MDEDYAVIRQMILAIAKDYKLHPKVAQELLHNILRVLEDYNVISNNSEEKGNGS